MSNFKRSVIFSSLFATLAFSGQVLAADPVSINITGKVVASPCTVDATGGKLSVDLGNIQATDLLAAGSSSTPVDFNLKFTGCPAGTTSVMATFTGTADPVAGASYYKNVDGGAANVAIALIQTSTGNLKGTGSSITQTVQADKTITMAMKAKAYSSAGTAMPGNISATVTATFTYQ